MEFVKDTCKVEKEQQCASCENGWLGETWCSETEEMPSESENDESKCELLQ